MIDWGRNEMNFNAFEIYWLLAEQQKARGNSMLAESFYKKAMEAAKNNDSNSKEAVITSNTAHISNSHPKNLSSSK